MALILKSTYFKEVELEEADLPIYIGAVQAVMKTELLDAVLKKYPIHRLAIKPLSEKVYAEFDWVTNIMCLNNRAHLPPDQKQQAEIMAYRGQNEDEYRQGFLIHECGHWN